LPWDNVRFAVRGAAVYLLCPSLALHKISAVERFGHCVCGWMDSDNGNTQHVCALYCACGRKTAAVNKRKRLCMLAALAALGRYYRRCHYHPAAGAGAPRFLRAARYWLLSRLCARASAEKKRPLSGCVYAFSRYLRMGQWGLPTRRGASLSPVDVSRNTVERLIPGLVPHLRQERRATCWRRRVALDASANGLAVGAFCVISGWREYVSDLRAAGAVNCAFSAL